MSVCVCVRVWTLHTSLIYVEKNPVPLGPGRKRSNSVPPECSSGGPTAGREWEEYLQIRGLVEKIRKKQRGESRPPFSHDGLPSLIKTTPLPPGAQACRSCLRAAETTTSPT